MKMFNPAHPGEILREDVLPGLNLTVTEAAKQLGIARVTLSRLLNNHSGVSADMAIRLAQWLRGDPETWLRLQMQYDLWQAEQRLKATPMHVQPAPVQA